MHRGALQRRPWSVAVGLALCVLAGVAAMSRPTQAATGDVYTLEPDYTTSVAARVHGPWGATFVNTKVIVGPDGVPAWGFCAQAPVGGGVSGGTQTPVDDLADDNSEAVRANAHRLQAILDASMLPPPREMQWLADGQVLDYDGNPVPEAEWRNLLHRYDTAPPMDSLPFAAKDRIEIIAIQAAIWHYTDGFDPDAGGSFSDQGLYTQWNLPWEAGTVTPADMRARYDELVAIGDAATPPVVPTIDVAARQEGNTVIFDLTTEGLDEVTVDSAGRDLHPYDNESGVCDTSTIVDTVDTSSGAASVCTVITTSESVAIEAVGSVDRPALVYLDQPSSQDSVISGRETVAVAGYAMIPAEVVTDPDDPDEPDHPATPGRPGPPRVPGSPVPGTPTFAG